jgi:hypothetical protein
MKLQKAVRQDDSLAASATWKPKELRRLKVSENGGRAAQRKALIMNNKIESTYTLLVRSEERGRSMMEVGGFTLIALSALVAIWQFAQQPTSLPLDRVNTVDREWLAKAAS